MYHRHFIFISISTILSTLHALTIPHLPNLPNSNPTLLNTTTTPHTLTFLGVSCYHLAPSTSTVTLALCQPLFAHLVREGDVYRPQHWWNGWHFRSPGFPTPGPCTISISSPVKDRRHYTVDLSIGDVLKYAIEVLETCEGVGTGGENVFDGMWRVEVTRNPRVDGR